MYCCNLIKPKSSAFFNPARSRIVACSFGVNNSLFGNADSEEHGKYTHNCAKAGADDILGCLIFPDKADNKHYHERCGVADCR